MQKYVREPSSVFSVFLSRAAGEIWQNGVEASPQEEAS